MRTIIAILVALPLCGATVSDTFNHYGKSGAQLAVSAKWGGIVTRGYIGTNYAFLSSQGYYGYAYSATTFGTAQFAQGILKAGTSTNGNSMGVAVRIDNAADTLYGCRSEIGSNLIITRRVEGSNTDVDTETTTSVVGDIIRLTADSGTVTCTLTDRETGNVRATASYSDGSPLTGARVGPWGVGTSTAAAGLDDFVGGDLADMGDYLPYGTATNRYASATGSLLCDGSISCPLPLEKAAYDAVAGQTWWLRAGTYDYSIWRAFAASGTSGSPIIFRAYPGEVPLFDGVVSGSEYGVRTTGNYVTLRGVELYNSATAKAFELKNTSSQADNAENKTGGGWLTSAGIIAANLINSVLHNIEGPYWGDGSGEVYGNISYNVSMDTFDRPHGHHAYVRHPYNSGATRLFAENLMMSGNDYTQQGYGEANVDYTLRGNVAQHNAGIWWDSCTEGRDNTFLMEENFIAPSVSYAALGYRYRCSGNVVRNNVFGAGFQLAANTATFTGNRIVAGDKIIATPEGNPTMSGSTIDNNAYWNYTSGTLIGNDGKANYTAAQWQALGYDTNGTFTAGDPTGAWVYVRPNAYEAGRGHVIVYNWDEADTVNADVSTVLNVGDTYAVYNAMSPKVSIATGTYAGGNLAMPMAPVSNPDYIATDLGNMPWNTGTPGETCGETVAVARGWQYGADAPTGECTGDWTDPTKWYLRTSNGQMYYCNAGTWTNEANASACKIHTFTRVQTSEKRFGVFLIRRTYDARAATTIQWRGAITDTVQGGYKKADGSYVWNELPVHSITCTDGLCSASMPQAVGDAYWRINGGVALRAAAN